MGIVLEDIKKTFSGVSNVIYYYYLLCRGTTETTDKLWVLLSTKSKSKGIKEFQAFSIDNLKNKPKCKILLC